MKRILVLAVASVLLFSNIACAQMNTSLFITGINYKTEDNIELVFGDNTVREVTIKWTEREALSVFDKDGRKIPAVITSRAADRLGFFAPEVASGEICTFELRRVSYGARNDIVYTGFFAATSGWKIEYHAPPRFRKPITPPTAATTEDVFIRDMEYEQGGHLEVRFGCIKGKKINLEWSGGETISVKDEIGATYGAQILEYGHNEIEIRIHNVIENMNYVIEIAKVPYGGKTIAFKTTFTARQDWKYRPPRL